jgi:hypothetical protein
MSTQNDDQDHDSIYTKCQHKPVTPNKKQNGKTKYVSCYITNHYIPIDTKASALLSDIVANTKFCNVIGKMLPLHQTSCLETFHSVMIHFLPKSTAFSYEGMLGRYIYFQLHCKTYMYTNIINKNEVSCSTLQRKFEQRMFCYKRRK